MRSRLVSAAVFGTFVVLSSFCRAAHAQNPVETKTMPKLEAKQTTVLLLPTVGENGQSGGRLTACNNEMRSQFTERGFQIKDATTPGVVPPPAPLPAPADTSSATPAPPPIPPVPVSAVDFSVSTNRSLDNLVRAGRDAGADFVCLMVVEKVKTFGFLEIPRNPFHAYFDNLWLRRAYVGPVSLTSGIPSSLGLPIPFTLPNNKWGSTVHTYLIDVRGNSAVLFNHKTYGNSEGFMLGRSRSKVGPSGAVQDAAMFILSRTLKDYKKTN